MPKFFIDKKDITNQKITITGQDAVHISKVLRTEVGETLTLCDGDGTDFLAKVTACSKDSVSFDILESYACLSEPEVLVTLFQGLPKQGKMDYIIEKCTELGVSRIVPVATKRSVVKINDKKSEEKKLEVLKNAKRFAKGTMFNVPLHRQSRKTTPYQSYTLAIPLV